MLRITPLYGSHFNPYGEAEEPTCTLIELSNCRCLINVGYNPTFWSHVIHSSSTANDELIKRIPDHDCVFIMNSTWQCLGGLPLYYEYIRTQYNNGSISFIPPIYATYPTIKMGQMTLYDYHATIAMDGNSPPYTLQSIDNVFASITAIKFSQQIFLSASPERVSTNQSSGPQLSVTAHRAGYVVGGAYYVIQRLSDETVIVFTDSAYHMSKELHLEACTLLQHGTTTPDVFITRPGGPPFRQIRALYTDDAGKTAKQKKQQKLLQQPLVAQAERNLIESIMAVLRRDGNVLLPVDTSGRVLELLLLLHYEWEQQRYMNAYNLIYYAPMCHNVLDYAKSQLEWMSNALNTQFADYGKHPYRFTTTSGSSNTTRTMQVCTSLSELNTILEDRQNPSCVLASGLSLEGGPSRDVLLKWADNPDNAIIFTDSSQCYVRRTFYDGSRSTPAGVLASSNAVQEQDALLERTQTLDDTALSRDDDIVTTSEAVVSVGTSAMIPTTIDNADAEEADEDVTTIGEALTDNTKSIWTTAGQLLRAWVHAKAMGVEMADSVMVDVNVPIRAPLAGVELKTFLAQEEAKRQAHIKAAEKRAMLAQVELAKGQLHLGEDDGAVPIISSSDATKPASTATSSSVSSTIARANVRPRKKSRFDSSLFLKFSKPLHMTFDIREEAVGLGQPDSVAKYGIGESVGRSGEVLEDDYGISVEADRFTDIVSGVDPSKFAGGSGRIGDEVKRRGLGYDLDNIGSRKSKSAAAASNSNASRVVSDVDERDDDAILDEQAQEAMDLSEGLGIIRGRNGRLPTKVSTVPRKLEVLAEVSYIPGLEGRVDARAARQSIRALQPREVVILGGMKDDSSIEISESIDSNLVTDEVRVLAEAAQAFVKGNKAIWTPSNSETIELGVGHSAYSVRLVDKPYRPANQMEIDSVAKGVPESIEPLEIKLGMCNVSLVDCVATGQKVALDGSIVLAPHMSSISDNKNDGSSIYLSDGEILLTDMRTELIALGMKAEYSSHTGYSQLLVNGKIILRKVQNQDGIGRMQIEGPLCEDFYAVRSILSGQYVTL